MSTRYTAEDHARENSPTAVKVRNMIRKLSIKFTRRVLWRLVGHDDVDEKDIDAEAFTGVGFYSRPPEGGSAEVIVVSLGGPRARAIVASRDEATRKTIAELAENETAIFTTLSTVVIKADGTVEIRSKNGTALPLATKADLDALLSAITSAAVLGGDGGATLKENILAALGPLWPVGTTVLKAE